MLGRARLQSKEGIRKVVADGVELRRKIIGFWLPLLADKSRLLVVLVHMVGNRTEVIEESAVHRPALEPFPDRGPNQARPFRGNGIAQRKGALAVMHHIAETFVRRCALIDCGSGGGEPAF